MTNDIYHSLGSLEAKVDALIEASKRSEDKSDKSRAAMHKRVDELVDRVGGVEAAQAQTQKDITDMKPVTDDVKRWKIMGIGAMGIVGIAAAALGVTFGDAVKRIVMVMTGGRAG